MNGKCTVFMEKRTRRYGQLTTGARLAPLITGASLCGGLGSRPVRVRRWG